MKSNLQERLFLFLWLLFFVLLFLREFKNSWIPDRFKAGIIEEQIAKRSLLIDMELEKLSSGNEYRSFKDYSRLKLDFPLFVFDSSTLIFWNNNDIRPPSKSTNLENGYQFIDFGFNKSIRHVKRNRNLCFVAYNPLWKNVGIENQWLRKGSQENYSFNWNINSSDDCGEKIIPLKNLSLNLCFEEEKGILSANSESFRFSLIICALLLFTFAYLIIKREFSNLNDYRKTIVTYSAVFFFIGILLYEYYRRFFLDSDPESVFFVLYPYILAFLFSISLLGFKDLLSERLGSWYSYPVLFLVYAFSKSYWVEIFNKDQFDLNLINFVRLNWKTLEAYLGIFGMGIFFYLVFTQLLHQARKRLDSSSQKNIFIGLACCILFFLIDSGFTSSWYIGYFLTGALGILLFTGIAGKSLQTGTLNLLLILIFISTLLITETTFYGSQKKDKAGIIQFAESSRFNQLKIENELLKQAYEGIANDKLISIAFYNPMTSKDIIIQKVKKVYLDSYFDPFDVRIDFLNVNGNNLSPESGYRNIYYFRSNYLQKEKEVSSNIFFNPDPENKKSNDYFLLVPIKSGNNKVGDIIIEVYRDKSNPNSIFPKLLVDQKYSGLMNSKYNVSELDRRDLQSFLDNGQLSIDTSIVLEKIKESGFYYSKMNDTSILLITDADQIFVIQNRAASSSWFSNFSILFMIISLMSLIAYLLTSEVNWDIEVLPFRRKIQFFMNLAFLLPLIVVSLAVLKFMNDNDKKNVESDYLEKVEIIAEGVEIPFLDYKNGLIPKRVFLERASKSAGLFSLDYFIYENDGQLNSSSKDVLWERGITNKLIDSRAYEALNYWKKDYFIQNSKIDHFNYQISYAALYDLNNRQIGILSVPFYESSEDLETLFIQLLSTIMNIFVFAFIAFLIFSNRLTDWLMIPVLRLSDKIKITSFENENEPLEWSIKDEIGTLVNSYNEMIKKLNESRAALAITEKEAAWKEMAQQVAHEIKNPLTPMRLRLQQIIRFYQGRDSEEDQKMHNSMNSLLHQVDTLSEIAGSFSEFAKMPNPKNEIIELREVIKLASNIYQGKNGTEIMLDLPNEEVLVSADENMFSRSIGNIILNGIQSVPTTLVPRIRIKLMIENSVVILSISDNGEGVDEDIKDRIFIPHFSTKSAGTGIGLALAKKTVESAHGRIYFESKKGKGTSFFIEVPLASTKKDPATSAF